MRDREPEPEAFPGIGDPIERLEDPRVVLRRDALTGVHDVDLDGVADLSRFQSDVAARMPGGVVEERGERLVEQFALRQSCEPGRARDGAPSPLVADSL